MSTGGTEHTSSIAMCPVQRRARRRAEIPAWPAWRPPLGPSAWAGRVASNRGRVALLHASAHSRPGGIRQPRQPRVWTWRLRGPRDCYDLLARDIWLTGSWPVGWLPTGSYRTRVAVADVKSRRQRHGVESHRSHVATHHVKKAPGEEFCAALPGLLRRCSHR